MITKHEKQSYSSKIFLACFVILTVVFLVFFAFRKMKVIRTSGDEPYYLMIASSLIKDHDIALKNNFEQKDYRTFYRLPLGGHLSPNSVKPDEYSLHNVGLPIFIIPGFYTAGLKGAVAEIFLITVLLIIIFVRILQNIFSDNKKIITITVLTFLSVPVVFYTYMIANEIILTAVVVYFFYRLFFKKQSFSLLESWWFGFLIAILPWIHVKYIFISFLLLALTVIKKKDLRYTLNLVILPIIFFIGLSFFMKHFYGSYSFTAQYPAEWPTLLNSVKGFFGFLFDESFGIFIFNPLLILFPASIYATYKKNKEFAIYSFLFVFIVHSINSLYANKIGWVPAGRMMVAITPIIFIWISYLLVDLKKLALKILFYVLGVVSLMIGFILAYYPNRSYNNGSINNLFVIFAKYFHYNFSPLFPKLLAITDYLPQTNGWVSVTVDNWLKLLVWIIIIVIVNTLVILGIRNQKKTVNQ